jgi:hypothetical protein
MAIIPKNPINLQRFESHNYMTIPQGDKGAIGLFPGKPDVADHRTASLCGAVSLSNTYIIPFFAKGPGNEIRSQDISLSAHP